VNAIDVGANIVGAMIIITIICAVYSLYERYGSPL